MNQQYDVFISYSRLDTPVADMICKAFDNAGISYFIDRQGIIVGGEFPEIIAEAISNSHFFLFLASNNSYTSKYTKKEIHFAFNIKPDSLLPYIIDDSELPISLKFTFSDINIRTIKDHPIVETLVPDVLKLLGREKEIIIQNEKERILNYLQLTESWMKKVENVKANKEVKNEIEQQNKIITEDIIIDYVPVSFLWDKFIALLLKHEIIPVIGPDYIIENNDNYHKRIINFIAKEIEIPNEIDSFTELISSPEFIRLSRNKNIIYSLIDQIICEIEISPSPWLESLIVSKLFPFIINTSFTPSIENEMIKVWKNEVNCISYDYHIHRESTYYFDLRDENILSRPTICYIFGKHSSWPTFAITEKDVRAYCKSWISKELDRGLYEILERQHLLFIGYHPYEGEDAFLWKYLQSEKEFNDPLFSEFLEVLGKGIVLAPEVVIREISDRVRSVQEKDSI